MQYIYNIAAYTRMTCIYSDLQNTMVRTAPTEYQYQKQIQKLCTFQV